mgnify:CR=1 FL=1
MINTKSKGSKAERELIHLFWKNNWAALRSAGSGSTKYPSPDILASNNIRKIAIEAKSVKNNYIYINKKQIFELIEFSRMFGCEYYIGAKFEKKGWYFLSIDDFSPSPGQGAIAIVARIDDIQTIEMLKKIEDLDSRLEIEAERALSDFIDSGCRFPLGAYAKSNGSEMTLSVSAFSVDGKQSLHVTRSGDKNNPKSLGRQVGEELRSKGINDLALNWREKVEEWNKS